MTAAQQQQVDLQNVPVVLNMIDTTDKTIQQVSDQLAEAMILQGSQSSDGEGNRPHQDEVGRFCPIGLLLEQGTEPFDSDICLEGLVEEFEEGELGINDAFIRDNQSALNKIQTIHDINRIPNRQVLLNRLQEDDVDGSSWQPWVDLGVDPSAPLVPDYFY